MSTAAVVIERVIAAPPARVYRAWLDPATLARWSAPVGWENARSEVDERVGGHYRAWHAGPDGTDMGGYDAEILELVPDEKIVLRWEFVGPDREPPGARTASLLTVTLAPAPGGATALTLVHERLDGLAAPRPDIADNVHAGWAGTLGRLADVLT